MSAELTTKEFEKVEQVAKTFNGGISNAVFAGAEALAEVRLPMNYQGFHAALDILVASYVSQTKKGLTETTLMSFMQWSGEQMKKEAEEQANAEYRAYDPRN